MPSVLCGKKTFYLVAVPLRLIGVAILEGGVPRREVEDRSLVDGGVPMRLVENERVILIKQKRSTILVHKGVKILYS